MSSTRFVRWSGAALILAGILAALSYLFHPLSPDLGAMQSASWIFSHGLTGIAFLLLLPGLAGLYAHLGEQSGIVGLVGFTLATIASALAAGLLLFIESTLLPVAAAVPAYVPLVDPASDVYSGSLALPLFLSTVVLFALGFVLLGIAVLRSSSLPRLTGYLIIVGGVLFALPVPPAPVIVNTIGIVLQGIGFASVGYALWRGAGQTAVGTKMAVGVQS